MKKLNFFLVSIALTGILFLSSCEKDKDEPKDPSTTDQTIAEYLVANPDYSILVEAATKAGLVDELSGTTNLTLFAPPNSAFNALFTELGVSGIADLSAETLTPILLYHVLGGEKKSPALSAGYYPTLSPAQGNFASMNISLSGGVKIDNDAMVTTADIDVKNGVIHVINKVLLPPTVVDIALDNSNFSILVEAVVKANLVETLNGSGPFTIFAPTNAAFEALFTDLGVSGIADLTAEQLTPILLYHVVSGNVRSNQLSDGPVETLNGTIVISMSPAPTINGNTAIIATDVQATNGVVHVIDKVLLPGKTIAEIAASDDNFSILVEALTKAGLVEVMNGPGNFTVFAPTNAAFSALFTQLGVSGIADLSAETLTPILLYHVLGTEKKSGDLTAGYYSTLSPAQGNYASMNVSISDGVYIDKDTKVTTADIDAINGVIHVVDKVLLPPSVVDLALDNSNFSILVEAVVKANLVETLSGPGPFTIFAPTNAAFEELFTTLGVSGIADLTAEQLTPILLYHVVSGNVRSTSLTAGSVVTLNGSILIALSPSPTINGTANIIATDVQATNGVVHVIDEVLLPVTK
jgi:transforming growth factor-beta-induced protein